MSDVEYVPIRQKIKILAIDNDRTVTLEINGRPQNFLVGDTIEFDGYAPLEP